MSLYIIKGCDVTEKTLKQDFHNFDNTYGKMHTPLSFLLVHEIW